MEHKEELETRERNARLAALAVCRYLSKKASRISVCFLISGISTISLLGLPLFVSSMLLRFSTWLSHQSAALLPPLTYLFVHPHTPTDINIWEVVNRDTASVTVKHNHLTAPVTYRSPTDLLTTMPDQNLNSSPDDSSFLALVTENKHFRTALTCL
ncbi:hypothetical protein ATANTOWER_007008 [Ataeniobius toweri]|uniref:Uncharacterized protein n=1 Tax=Ataeniobius toweri TaxID=208326 RepID=A0ABU7BRT8_9TELE|nr:hypothetical protein [Ataeniobius toweri]